MGERDLGGRAFVGSETTVLRNLEEWKVTNGL